MVRIITEEDATISFDLEIKTSVYPGISAHTLSNFIGRGTGNLRQRAGGNAIVDVNAHGNAEFDVAHVAQRRNQIEDDAAAADANAFGVEISFGACIVVAPHTRLQAFGESQIAVHNQCTSGLNERGVVGETFEVGFFGAIDVQVIGIR